MSELMTTSLFAAISLWASAQKTVAVGVTGSFSKGVPDRYSDYDLVVYTTGEPVAARASFRRNIVEPAGDVIARFTADHLGNDNTDIYYIADGSGVLKIDVSFQVASASVVVPPDLAILSDAPGILTQAVKGPVAAIKEADLLEKLLGWLWFTHARIERGELFAAARSIDFSREAGLLPLMLKRLDLPQEGHRRLEFRLPSELLRQLDETYPSQLKKVALRAAMDSFYALVLQEAPAHLDNFEDYASRTNRLLRIVREDRLSNDHGRP